ncbi:O-antigen ligase family protein [Hymenobacter sp. RP-2-7]|uniref:O-antigen ligase family protein n=1 Tax=Hymenobacter polaris TaxID=2682546 RepID=A0A7Y0FM25_9BACT|nr:O-antigen ligase family protein [Hymenobacter polaris]NML65070.1 O-antigen ligase family protein [Hymenobacter polaris]
MRHLLLRLRPADSLQWVFVGFLALLTLGGGLAALVQQPAWLLPALAVPALVLVLARWQWLYYLLFLTLPFSHELVLGSLHIDVPSEPLLLSLLVCVPLALLLGPGGLGQLAPREWRHPLLLLPALMLAWAAFDTLFSVNVLHSVKYLLAKCWYLVPCLLGTLLLVRRPADFWRVAACYTGAGVVALAWVMPRHATQGFSFAKVGWAVQPFFINHVIYATVLALLLPLAGGLAQQASTPGRRRWWLAAGGLLLFGLITSYTRASWLALPVAGLYYWVLRRRLTRWLLLGLAVAGVGSAVYFTGADRFMNYAPDFEKTVWHGGNFEAHLASTYKLQDVSGMERVYRWVAAARMVADKPLTGTGPSTFYPEYKRYTLKSFRTYVSANPEHSTTHNYFLLQLAEQGVPGFLLFAALVATTLLTAERLYHASAARPEVRRIVLAVVLSLVIILFHLFLNELLEVDKIGTFFFVGLAALIRCDSWTADLTDLTDFADTPPAVADDAHSAVLPAPGA